MGEQIDRFKMLAQKLAEATPSFFDINGPGKGDHATNAFMTKLRALAKMHYGKDLHERQCVPGANFRFDFYLEDEKTVVEIALSLRNPNSEFEKDLLKCILAKEQGLEIDYLLLICKPGGMKKAEEPGRRRMVELVKEKFGITVETWDIVPSLETIES
jgi:hypothetical protein